MTNLRSLVGLAALLPLALGCAARSAPFDQMDRAQITVLRLSQPQAANPVPQATGIPGLPSLPIPPELQQLGQQVLQGLQGAVPGVIPPGTLPGAQPQQPALPQFKGMSIVAQMPVTDEHFKDELLDIFGHESNFSSQVGNCFTPGMGIVMQRPNAPEIDLMVSLSCNQARLVDGSAWPYRVNGFTPETRAHLAKIYEKLWGPVPAGA